MPQKMKQAVLSALVIGALVGWSRPSEATSLTVNFCPGDATCPAGVTQASLTFTPDTGTLDANDYLVDLIIAGNSSSPAFVDEVSFTIDGVQTPAGYDALPSLTAVPSTGAPWLTFFDTVSGSAGSCTTNTGSSQEVCSGSGGDGNHGAALPGQILEWTYYVNLSGSTTVGAGSNVNLRAQFLTDDGKNAGLLSPGGGALLVSCAAGEPACVTTTAAVPEPATLTLFGIGLGIVARRVRRRGPQ